MLRPRAPSSVLPPDTHAEIGHVDIHRATVASIKFQGHVCTVTRGDGIEGEVYFCPSPLILLNSDLERSPNL